jgi:four helix bundle protein
MPTIHRFEDLIAWQKGRLLSSRVHTVTRDKAFQDDYDLKRQIRRSAGSVMDNVAEGFGRGSRGEFIQFLSVARGSLAEVKSQLYRSLDNQYITNELFGELYAQCDEVGRLIDSLLLYLNSTDKKGRRYSQGNVGEESIHYFSTL